MSETDRQKWDERYRTGSYTSRNYPTPLLAEWAPRLTRGRALDVACGAGRNSLFLAAAGWQVDAVDISPVGLERARTAASERGLEINWIEADLEEAGAGTLPSGPYALIVVARYVDRPLMPELLRRLGPGGALLCEQHVESTQDVIGPTSPAFRVRSNELLRDVMAQGPSDLKMDLKVLYYREGITTEPDGRRAALSQLVVRADNDC